MVGNASNFDFVGGSGLRARAGSKPLWDDAPGDLFTAHLAMIRDFAKQSRVRVFLEQQRPTIERAESDLRRVVDMADLEMWLKAQFSARPRTMQLFVSPLTSGFNWTNLDQQAPKLWVPPPAPKAFDNPVDRFVTIGTVFTEVDHNYVNQATSTRLAAVNALFANREEWGTSAAWKNYDTPELVFNEYMTWAAFVEYASDRITLTDFQPFRQRIVTFMEARRGFTRFGRFAEVLSTARQRFPNQRIEDLMDGIVTERDYK